jgi:hypothetical protein
MRLSLNTGAGGNNREKFEVCPSPLHWAAVLAVGSGPGGPGQGACSEARGLAAVQWDRAAHRWLKRSSTRPQPASGATRPFDTGVFHT